MEGIATTASELKQYFYQCTSEVAQFRDLLAAELASDMALHRKHQDMLAIMYAQRDEWQEQANALGIIVAELNRNPIKLLISMYINILTRRKSALAQWSEALDRIAVLSHVCANTLALMQRNERRRELTGA